MAGMTGATDRSSPMEECGVCLESHCVDRTVVNFVKALRNAEVRVSPAETLDAMEVMRLVGMRDREILKHSLCLALAKTPEEKARFDVCFERFAINTSDIHAFRADLKIDFQIQFSPVVLYVTNTCCDQF